VISNISYLEKFPHAWSQVSEKGKNMVTLSPPVNWKTFCFYGHALDHEPSLEEDQSNYFRKMKMQVVGTSIEKLE